MQCPWCLRWALKTACNFIFACGLDSEGKFHIGSGCGKSWCFYCGKKFCGQYYNEITGEKLVACKDFHNECCKNEKGFLQEEYCEGGHDSHCSKRW